MVAVTSCTARANVGGAEKKKPRRIEGWLTQLTREYPHDIPYDALRVPSGLIISSLLQVPVPFSCIRDEQVRRSMMIFEWRLGRS